MSGHSGALSIWRLRQGGVWTHLASTALSTVRGVKIFSLIVSWGRTWPLSDRRLATTSRKSPEDWGVCVGKGNGLRHIADQRWNRSPLSPLLLDYTGEGEGCWSNGRDRGISRHNTVRSALGREKGLGFVGGQRKY